MVYYTHVGTRFPMTPDVQHSYIHKSMDSDDCEEEDIIVLGGDKELKIKWQDKMWK